MTYGSVCSGIEAASLAWRPLGWHAAWFAEIEPFPSAVLSHRFPETPNYGDFTKIGADAPAIDLLVGGTPCQSFSVAGLRAGLADERGNLALEYLRLAGRLRPRWLVWENVAGVFSSSSHDAPDPRPPTNPLDMERDGQEVATVEDYRSEELHAFNCFLAGLSELGYGWAYRVFDAQYAGVPQRRRRVFVVGHLGSWQRAAAVLFERHSLQGHPPPSREAREGFTHDIAPSIGASGRGFERAGDTRGQDPVIACFGGNNQSGEIAVSTAMRAHGSPHCDFESETFLVAPIAFHGAQDPDASGDVTHPVGRNGGLETCVAFSCKNHAQDSGDTAPTLRAMGHDGSHQNGGGQVAVAMVSGGSYPDTTDGDTSLTLTGRHGDNSAVFFNVRGRDGGAMPESADVASVRSASGGSSRSYVASFDERNITSRENRSRVEYGDPSHTLHEAPPAIIGSGVRRLTPRECERLQGLPDNWTLVPYRGKPAADGPRYKAIGNSMAVPCMRWIGERIAAVEKIGKALAMEAGR